MALQYNHEVNHSRRLAMKKEMHKTHAALMKRTSLSTRSWQRQLEVCRDLPLILQQTGYSRKQTCFRYPWPVKTLICFWNITCATLLLLLQLDNVLQKSSTSYFCVDFMPLVRVHVVWVHQRFKVSWDLCLLVMWQNWKIKRDLPVSWSLIEIISPDIRRREKTCPPLSHPPSLRQFTGLFLLLAFSACMLF